MSTTLRSQGDLITPEIFQKLLPVHHLIFKFLRTIKPATLFRTCRQMYEELIPTMYERLVIGENNYHLVAGRRYCNILGCSWSTACERCNEANNTIKCRYYHRSDLKAQAITHTKILSFVHRNGAEALIDDYRCCMCHQNRRRSARSFPNIHRIHMGEHVVRQQIANYLQAEIKHRGDDDGIWSFNGYLMDYLPAPDDCYTICLDWPIEWKREDWINYLKWKGEEWEDLLKVGLQLYLSGLAWYPWCKEIILHLEHSHLRHVSLTWKQVTRNKDLTVYIEGFHNETDISSLIEDCWKHVVTLSEADRFKDLSIRYSVPRLPGVEEILKLQEELHQDVPELFTLFLERLQIREEECECKGR